MKYYNNNNYETFRLNILKFSHYNNETSKRYQHQLTNYAKLYEDFVQNSKHNIELNFKYLLPAIVSDYIKRPILIFHSTPKTYNIVYYSI